MLYFDIRNSRNLQLDLPQLPVFDYDDKTEFTDDGDFEGDGDDEIDDDINDSDIDENLMRTVVNIIPMIKAVLVLLTWMMSNNWYITGLMSYDSWEWNKDYIDNKLITVTLLPFTTTGPPNNYSLNVYWLWY